MPDTDTRGQDALLEEKLKHRLKSISLPENTVKANAARQAYEAGWKAAAEVAANGPDTHPADRHRRISQERLDMLRKEMPKTGVGWLSIWEYNVEDTCRWYARMGYGERVEFAARAGWQDFLKNNPEQTSPEMMRERRTLLRDMQNHGGEYLPRTGALPYMPRTSEGIRWLLEQVKYGPSP